MTAFVRITLQYYSLNTLLDLCTAVCSTLYSSLCVLALSLFMQRVFHALDCVAHKMKDKNRVISTFGGYEVEKNSTRAKRIYSTLAASASSKESVSSIASLPEPLKIEAPTCVGRTANYVVMLCVASASMKKSRSCTHSLHRPTHVVFTHCILVIVHTR